MQSESRLPTSLLILRNYLRARIDRTVIHKKERWLSFAAVIGLFAFRMVWVQGYFAIAYLYGFFVLQNIILFLTPSGLPTIQEEEENEQTVYDIPENVTFERNEDASKPVIRKLGEFNLWCAYQEEDDVLGDSGVFCHVLRRAGHPCFLAGSAVLFCVRHADHRD